MIKIRDFAFSETDDRHKGLGLDVPKANKPKRLNRLFYRRSGGSTASSSSDEGGDDGEEREGWNGFKWGFGRLSWSGFGGGGGGGGGGKGSGGPKGGGLEGVEKPSKIDFERNFDVDNASPFESPSVEVDDDDFVDAGEEEEDEEEGEDEEGDPEDTPLYPGLYKALYTFEPEGTAEMKLEEDQIVRVIGRGGGMGWAVVVRGGEGEGGHALVPESYLEVWELDKQDEGE